MRWIEVLAAKHEEFAKIISHRFYEAARLNGQKDQFCGDDREPRNGGRLMEDPQPEPIVPRHPISDSAYQIAVVLAVLLLLATVSLF